MAVQAQLGGFATGYLPLPLPCGGGHSFPEEQMRAFGVGDYGYNCLGVVVSGTQSELTCNGSGGVVPSSSRKRGSEEAGCFECERVRAGLERARKRQRQEMVRAVVGVVERRLREAEAELAAAHRRAAELEARAAQAAAESQAWCGVARGHEALAAELRAALDYRLLLLRGGAVEGSGECSSRACAGDAQSCCLDDAAPAAGRKWACKACGEGEAAVLLLPCRHLCLCKACEPRTDACPVCLVVKNASIHVAPN